MSPSEYRGMPPHLNSGGESVGPCSNTAQNHANRSRWKTVSRRVKAPKQGSGLGALVDYLSVTIPDADHLLSAVGEEAFGLKLLRMVFGEKQPFSATEFTGAGFQGYTNSALVVGKGGEIVGRIACGGNADTVHVSLSGDGCAYVENWNRVAHGLTALNAKVTRCDLAFDDYRGEHFSPRAMHEAIEAGELRIRAPGPGQPPKTRYITDHGHGTGCTLYAGRKGHKELCIYDKGKEQGDPNSPWVRVEVRFYAKHVDLPIAMLCDPLPYLRAAYNVCEHIPANVTERIRTKRHKIECSAVAWTRWLQTQVGGSLHLLRDALGSDTDAFIAQALARDATPARFSKFDRASLVQYIREGLGHVGSRDPVGALA